MQPDQHLQKRRSFVAPLITIAASIALGGGSCYGFLGTLDIAGHGRYTSLNLFFLIVFCLCVLVFGGTILWMIVRAVRHWLENQ